MSSPPPSTDGRLPADRADAGSTPADHPEPDAARLRDELRAALNEVAHLRIALENSREIGTAMGILMHQRRVGSEAAFELLREASQRSNRKLRDIAADVVYLGTLPD